MPSVDSLSKSGLQKGGVGDYGAEIENDRGIYPAIVVPYGTNDNSEQNRIRARIVSLDENGNIKGKVSINEENYNKYSGKDRGIADNELVLCMPLLPEFFHVRPQVGEMVFVIMENPKDNAGVRYWIGPIISSKLKLKFQSYEDSVKMFNKTDFISNRKIGSVVELVELFPEESDIAIQGRNDADLILKNREVLLIAGKFNKENFSINSETPSHFKLKQIDNSNISKINAKPSPITHNIQVTIIEDISNPINYIVNISVVEKKTLFVLKDESNKYADRKFAIEWLKTRIKEAKEKYKSWSFSSMNLMNGKGILEFKNEPSDINVKATPSPTTPPSTNNQQLLQKFSQATLLSTNINIYSPRGKFRGNDLKGFEKNPDLKSFGEFADTLHPAIFGDEVVRLLDIIIRLLLTHIHTPQMPLLTTSLADELKKYTVDGFLQNLLSYHVRIN